MQIPKKTSHKTKALALIINVSVLSLSLSYIVLAAPWSGPSAPPPGNNTEIPINVGIDGQIKTGNLQVNAMAIIAAGNALLVPNGNVVIGTTDPRSTLDVNGNLKISGTTEGAETPPNYAGLYMPSADVIVGGGADSVFAFRHIDVAGEDNHMVFGNQNIGGSANGPAAMTINSEYRRVGIGLIDSSVRPNANLEIRMSNAVPTEGIHISRDAAMGFSYLNIEDESSDPIFKVHENGNVGIGTVTPQFKISLGDDGGIYAKGKFGVGATLIDTPLSNDAEFIWYPRKAAFRVGNAVAANWDNANIGDYSMAGGANATAKGWSAIAFGNNAIANGSTSVALGFGNVANGNGSVALGSQITVTGNNSLGIGLEGVGPGPIITQSNTMAIMGGNVGIETATPSEKLEVNGGVRLNTTAVKPACDFTKRGTVWFSQGVAGVKDTLEVCAKDAADAYAWRILY